LFFTGLRVIKMDLKTGVIFLCFFQAITGTNANSDEGLTTEDVVDKYEKECLYISKSLARRVFIG
jgi:hypothetical protein